MPTGNLSDHLECRLVDDPDVTRLRVRHVGVRLGLLGGLRRACWRRPRSRCWPGRHGRHAGQHVDGTAAPAGAVAGVGRRRHVGPAGAARTRCRGDGASWRVRRSRSPVVHRFVRICGPGVCSNTRRRRLAELRPCRRWRSNRPLRKSRGHQGEGQASAASHRVSSRSRGRGGRNVDPGHVGFKDTSIQAASIQDMWTQRITRDPALADIPRDRLQSGCRWVAATLFGTTIDQASSTMSRTSTASIVASRTTSQL